MGKFNLIASLGLFSPESVGTGAAFCIINSAFRRMNDEHNLEPVWRATSASSRARGEKIARMHCIPIAVIRLRRAKGKRSIACHGQILITRKITFATLLGVFFVPSHAPRSSTPVNGNNEYILSMLSFFLYFATYIISGCNHWNIPAGLKQRHWRRRLIAKYTCTKKIQAHWEHCTVRFSRML